LVEKSKFLNPFAVLIMFEPIQIENLKHFIKHLRSGQVWPGRPRLYAADVVLEIQEKTFT
jgi:hypothetical protein